MRDLHSVGCNVPVVLALEGRQNGYCGRFQSIEMLSIKVKLPVLLDEEFQSLSVGEHHICINAEVIITRKILSAQIPVRKQ